MRNVFLMIVVAAASSCVLPVAVAQSPSSSLRTLTETLSSNYADCVIKWVGDNLLASASPSEMADGGHSACHDQFRAFEEAETKYLLSMTPSSVPELAAINKARSIASDVREITRKHIIRLVIESRSDK